MQNHPLARTIQNHSSAPLYRSTHDSGTEAPELQSDCPPYSPPHPMIHWQFQRMEHLHAQIGARAIPNTLQSSEPRASFAIQEASFCLAPNALQSTPERLFQYRSAEFGSRGRSGLGPCSLPAQPRAPSIRLASSFSSPWSNPFQSRPRPARRCRPCSRRSPRPE